MPNLPLYIYIDEAGNFDFTPKGTKYYTITGVVTHHPSIICNELNEKRHNFLSGRELPNLGQDYLESHLAFKFHASEDKQPVRDEVFKIIQTSPRGVIKAHSIIAEKNKANPSIRPAADFYHKLVMPLLKFALKGYDFSHLLIFLDTPPVNSQKRALVGSIKSTISDFFPNKTYSLFCVPSESNYLLQVADYFNWAIFRKWERGNTRSYMLIQDRLEKTELDIFAKGSTTYY